MTSPVIVGQGTRWRFDRGSLWEHFVLLTVAVFVLVPLAFLVLGSFSTASMPTELSLDQMSLENYTETWLDPNILKLLYNTSVYVGGSTALGISIAVALAWLVERTNMPGKSWLYAGIPISLAVPGLLQAMAWVLLLSPRSGFINQWLIAQFGLESRPINIYSMGGMIFVEGLRLVPTAFLMLVPLLRSMDPVFEEAASVSGAPPTSIVRKVTLKLMAPGIIAITIYQAMTALEIFEIPGLLGMPVGLHVFATKIYATLQSSHGLPIYGQANALAMLYLLIGVTCAALYWYMIRRSERYTVVTGKGYRPQLTDLAAWRYPSLAFAVLFLILSVGLPFLVLVYTSLVPHLQAPSWSVLQNLTLKNYDLVFRYPDVAQALRNTVIMVVATATATTLASFLISLVVVRGRFWGRRTLDQLAFVPHAIPGMVAGLAFLWLFLNLDMFGTIASIVIGFTVSFISYGTRSMNAAILQIHRELEEAAHVSGAPPWRTMLRVFFPLMIPTFVGLWIWVVLLSVRIAGLPLVLYQDVSNLVLAVLIWNMWDEGQVEAVAAIGVLLMTSLFLLALLLRYVSFGRSVAQTR